MVTRKKSVRPPSPSPHPEAHPEQRLRRSPRKKSAAQFHLARQEDAERVSRLNATKGARLLVDGGPAASAAASPREDSDAGEGKDEDGDVVGKHGEAVLIERTSSLSSKVDEDTDCRHAGVSPAPDLVEEQHTCYGSKKPLPIQVASSLNPKDGVDGSTSNDSFNSTDVVAAQHMSTGGKQPLPTEHEVTMIESSSSPSSEVDHDGDWSHIDSFDVATQRITFSEKQPLPTHDGSGNETSDSSNSFGSNDAASAQHGSYGSKQLPPLNDDSGHEASDLGNSFESTGTDVAPHHITTGLKQPLTLQVAGDGSDANTSSSSYASIVVAPYHKTTGLKRFPPTYISSDAPLTTNAAEDHVQDLDPSSLPPVVVTPTLSAYIIHDDEDSEVDDQARQILRDITRMVRTPANILGVDYLYELRPYVWECLAVRYPTRSAQVLQSDFEGCMNLIGRMKALEGSGKGFRITVAADGVAEMYNENELEWEELGRKAKYGEECRVFAALMDAKVERWEMLEDIRRLFDEHYRLEDKEDEDECSLVILGSPKLVVHNAAEEEKQILRDIGALARNEKYAASGQTYNLTEPAWKMIKDHNQRHTHSAAEMHDLFTERIHLFLRMQGLNNRAGFVVDEDRGCIHAEARAWRTLDKAENGRRKLACLKGKTLKNYGLFAEILEAFHHTYDARRRGNVEEWPQDVHLGEGKGETQQLQDGCGPPVCAGEYKRRDSRAAASVFTLDPMPTLTPQKDAFEGEVTQAELNVEALRLSYAPLNGETTPEFLRDPIGYEFTLDEAHSCFAKMAEYTSNLSALKQAKAGSGHWFKADVMGALKKQFGDKDVWRLLERNHDSFDMLRNKYGIQVPDEEKAKFMFWQEFGAMARNLDAYEGQSHPKRIAEVNNNMRAQKNTFREVLLDGAGFGFKTDEARKLFKLLIAIAKEEKLGPAFKPGTCDFHPLIWSAVAASLPGRTDVDCQLFYERSRDHLNMIVNNGGDGHRFPYFDYFEEIERLIHAHLKAEVTGKRKRVQADRMIEQTTTGTKRAFVEVEESMNHLEDTGSQPPPYEDRNEDTPEADQPPCQKRQTRHGDDFSFGNYQGRSNALFRAAESFHESFKASTEQLKHSIDKQSADFMAELKIQAEQIRARNTLFQNRHVEFTRVLTEQSHAFNNALKTDNENVESRNNALWAYFDNGTEQFKEAVAAQKEYAERAFGLVERKARMSLDDEGALSPALSSARAQIFAEKCLTPAGRCYLWEMVFCGKADMYLTFGNDDLHRQTWLRGFFRKIAPHEWQNYYIEPAPGQPRVFVPKPAAPPPSSIDARSQGSNTNIIVAQANGNRARPPSSLRLALSPFQERPALQHAGTATPGPELIAAQVAALQPVARTPLPPFLGQQVKNLAATPDTSAWLAQNTNPQVVSSHNSQVRNQHQGTPRPPGNPQRVFVPSASGTRNVPRPINIHAVSHTLFPRARCGQQTGASQHGTPTQDSTPFRQRWARNVDTPHPPKPTSFAQFEAHYRQRYPFVSQAEIKAMILDTMNEQEGGRTLFDQASGVAQSLSDTPTQGLFKGGTTYGPDGQPIRVPLAPVLPAIHQTPGAAAMIADARSHAAQSYSGLRLQGFYQGPSELPSVGGTPPTRANYGGRQQQPMLCRVGNSQTPVPKQTGALQFQDVPK